MSLIRSIAALASAACAIFVAYAFGHGISNGHTMPFLVGAGVAVVTVFLVLAQVRLGRGQGESS